MNSAFFAKILLFSASYFLTATLGLKMDAVSGFAALIWPPTGIALAIVCLFGFRFAIAVAIGAFFVNIYSGAPVASALGIAFGNTIEAVAGVYLLQRYAQFHPALARLRDVVALVVIGAFFSPMISATIGVASLWLGGARSLEGISETWRAWWLGDALHGSAYREVRCRIR